MNTVSVIIPALNEATCIADAAGSAQNAGADEVIVVDGGSSDDTVAVAQKYATVLTADQPGRAVQQNCGAEAAAGDILLFLHADCRLGPGAVEEIRKQMADRSDAVGGCFRQVIDAQGIRYRLVETGNALRARLLKWAYGDQGIFVRADVFRQLGGFPVQKLMEDLYFMKQLKRQGRFVSLKSPLTVSARRWQRNGVFTQTLRNWALVSAAHLGASPDWLARFYPNDR